MYFYTRCLTALSLMPVIVAGVLQAATVFSPDGAIAVQVQVKSMPAPYATGERLYYAATFNEQPLLLDSPFGLEFKGMPALGENLSIVDTKQASFSGEWSPVCGTQSKIVNAYNELRLTLEETSGAKRRLQFFVRIFDDGLAFRYGIPEQAAVSEFVLTKESSEFHFPGDPTCWIGAYPSFRTHQETEYSKKKLSEAKPGEIIACPLLLQLPHAWAALTEADLDDWAGLYFTRHGSAANAVVSLVSPRIDQPTAAVISKAPRLSPWRVMMIGEKPGDLIESNIIVNLAKPCEIKDTSWITPGISAWDIWWSGNYGPDYNGELKMDNASMKYFIDLAADMGWEYQLVDWTWYGPPFDPAKPFGSAANPATSILRQRPDIDIPELVTYAAAKHVKILIWLDNYHCDAEMEQAFPLYEKWGVAGVKVDFMARDDQQMVNFYHRLVKLAAKHHLVVDFHGAYKPTGFRRTYPNLITREGVLGNEYNKWSDRVTPTHNVTLPFTRMLCGPMDYTPGGFINKTPETFKVVGDDTPAPQVMTTRAQQLAMFVVYESPLQVACDSPYNYRTSPAGTEFLKAVPTTWDDTKVLDGYPGESIVIARRAGDEWFLGGMSNEQARRVSIDLGFLGAGQWQAHIFADADDAAQRPEKLAISNISVTAHETLTLDMAGSGGAAIQFTKVK